MKTVILCLLSFIIGILISIAGFASPGNTGVAVIGYNVLLPKSDFEQLVSEAAKAQRDATKAEEELQTIKAKWYNRSGEWVEDLF